MNVKMDGITVIQMQYAIIRLEVSFVRVGMVFRVMVNSVEILMSAIGANITAMLMQIALITMAHTVVFVTMDSPVMV